MRWVALLLVPVLLPGCGAPTSPDDGGGNGGVTSYVVNVLPGGISSSADLAEQVPQDALAWGVVIDGETGRPVGGASLYVYVPPTGRVEGRQGDHPLGRIETNSTGLFAINVAGDDSRLRIRAESGDKWGEAYIDRALGY